jgi:hypothetical protein
MSKKITEIPFWGVFVDCFPEKENVAIQQDETAITNEEWLEIARWWRNALLNESDWSQVSDNSLTEIQRESWRQYRQDLRNITDTFSNPKNIVFPDLPF